MPAGRAAGEKVKPFPRLNPQRILRSGKYKEYSLSDQAALAGILKTPYELHLSVVMTECVDTEDVQGR